MSDRAIYELVADLKKAAVHYGKPHEDGPHPELSKLIWEAADTLEEANAELID